MLSEPQPEHTAATADTPDTVALPPLPKGKVAVGLAGLAVAMFLLATIGMLESADVAERPWQHTIFVFAPSQPWEGGIEGHIRPIPTENLPEDPLLQALQATADGQALLEQLGYDLAERVFLLDMTREQWRTLLASGRPPEPGTHEVIAGPLARLDSFQMDGVEFDVVGRFDRSVAGMSFVYAAAWSDEAASCFTEDRAETVWIYPDGPPDDVEELDALPEETKVQSGVGRSDPAHIWATILAMILAAASGTAVWCLLYNWAGQAKGHTLAGAVFGEMRKHPVFLTGLHVLLYGVFFAAMIGAVMEPVMQWRLSALVQSTFSEGGLSFIGKAYDQGHILRAAAATWYWNYCVATVVLSILPSLVFPFWGLLKNLLSFALVGFALSPTYTGTAAGMTYHVGTMVLELEAYVVASFFICLHPVYLIQGLLEGRFRANARRTLRMVISGTVVVGVMLAIAALYEAATLILLH